MLNRRGTEQQRPESPTVALTWHASKYEVHVSDEGKGGRSEGRKERREVRKKKEVLAFNHSQK